MVKILRGAGPRRRRSIGRPIDRLAARLDSQFLDHALIRLIHKNRHRISRHVWRSAQPSPGDLAWAARRGVKTVLNLRGARNCGSYLFEKEACARLGLRLVDFPLGSREAPSAERLSELRAIFDAIAYPALMHCKSGSDRVGLGATLYLHWREGRPLRAARRQLSWRYGHVRAGKTGVLDHLFDHFEARKAAGGAEDFFAWTQGPDYDPDALKREFRSKGWADLLVEGLLRRE